MARFFSILALALVIIAGVAYLYFSSREVEVRFSEAQIQQALQRSLPVTRTYLVIFELTLDNPRVELAEDTGRVQAGLDITLAINSREGSKDFRGSADISGVPSFASPEAAFYLQAIEVERLEIAGLGDEQLERARSAVQLALSEYYRHHPIYRLKGESIRQRLARMALKDVEIDGDEVVITLGP
ncbi:DUF1439 domain-containing protein [Microbulbifer yueqingensis]|uniref:DUF1439 domain-containing protein n=1 Tax=Microbulbifer yueqingensis TaxID=658219 RepID=A0A1G8V0G7_9GAMM|nr:DUF1439 domain-containing protein [Microbulbifer yueqingensis]SDJ59347.1 Protein of unknown function [Microbulbifer yueqingensis]